MGAQGEKGQIFVEFIIISLLVISFVFIAQRELYKFKDINRSYQFGKDRTHGKMAPVKNRH